MVKPTGQRLTFIDSQQSVRNLTAENAAKHRHAIFTETERQCMSDEVVRSVPDHEPAQVLADLERFESNDNHITAPFSLFRGPFGVSKFPQSSTTATGHEIDERPMPTEDWLMGLEEIQGQDYNEIDLLDSLLDVPDVIPNPEPEIWDLISDPREASYTPRPQTQISPSYFTDNAEAWSILSHYKDRIVPLISPLGQGQEQSWMNLVMPCAVHTLGELTMNGSATHARLALLNALLSTSAFHLGNHATLCIEHWVSVGNQYLQRARNHFIRCLEEASFPTTMKSKYKEILMAVLSLSTAYMVKGDSERRLSCLIQAEKFIYVNGFKQSTLSTKRRALHHCYAYLRIMAETTRISSGLNMNMASTTSTFLDRDQVYTDFRIRPDITFSDNILDMEKDPNVAQRDLHLAIPGRWSLTLFPKMYGVAESFLMLLSQVIRLANERDLSMLPKRRDEVLNLNDFWIRAKALEKGIHLLLSSYTSCHTPTLTDDDQKGITKPRAQAMYTALLIFFHRRIHDLDAAMLRREVDAVRDSLVQIQQDEAGWGPGNTATLIWPAFIAACEAVGSEEQTFFSSWFESCFTMTGLVNASVAKQIIEMIWAKRREVGRFGGVCNWPDVLRAKNIRLMCT